jgi:hypothetical protein
MTERTELTRREAGSHVMDEEEKQFYAGLYLLKKLDLKAVDGGMELPVVLPSELSPLDEALQAMAVSDLLKINSKHGRWELTKTGLAHLAEHIDEAEQLIEEFDDEELPDVLAELERRNLDVFRARFLWGWFDGEFDDLVLFQRRRGVTPVETLWAFYLMSDEFYAELAKDLDGGQDDA